MLLSAFQFPDSTPEVKQCKQSFSGLAILNVDNESVNSMLHIVNLLYWDIGLGKVDDKKIFIIASFCHTWSCVRYY